MTYKEAAGQLRDLMQDWKLLMTDEEYEHSDIYKHDIEALQFGINAIEQAEKGETAKWVICCDGYYPFCSVCGEEPPGREMSRYCPNCGRRMVTPERKRRKNHEAVGNAVSKKTHARPCIAVVL